MPGIPHKKNLKKVLSCFIFRFTKSCRTFEGGLVCRTRRFGRTAEDRHFLH